MSRFALGLGAGEDAARTHGHLIALPDDLHYLAFERPKDLGERVLASRRHFRSLPDG